MRADPLLVVLTATLLSAPVLVQTILNDRMPLETAATRVAIILALTWCGVAVLGALLRATTEIPEVVEVRSDDQPDTPARDVP
ncbi:MAG TPA: hypothetical protein VFO49_11250 [Nocardioides sp.]|nr:hypothetical protein [Nocardioides sp.]